MKLSHDRTKSAATKVKCENAPAMGKTRRTRVCVLTAALSTGYRARLVLRKRIVDMKRPHRQIVARCDAWPCIAVTPAIPTAAFLLSLSLSHIISYAYCCRLYCYLNTLAHELGHLSLFHVQQYFHNLTLLRGTAVHGVPISVSISRWSCRWRKPKTAW